MYVCMYACVCVWMCLRVCAAACACVLQETVPPRWRLQLSPMDRADIFQFCNDALIYGALVNQHGQHWIAVVRHAGMLRHVDSCHSPRVLSDLDFATLLYTHPETYPLVDNDHTG